MTSKETSMLTVDKFSAMIENNVSKGVQRENEVIVGTHKKTGRRKKDA